MRGTVVEIFREEDVTSIGNDYTKEDAAEDEAWMQSGLEDLFKGTEVPFNARIITDRTQPRKSEESTGARNEPDWNLAKLYMAVFRR